MIFLYLLVIDLTIYFVLLLIYKNTSKQAKNLPVVYEMFIRDGKKSALRTPLQTSWFYGAVYAGLYFFSLPIFIWRYGIRNGLLLIFIPMILGAGVSLLTGDFGTTDGLFVGIITSVILRPIVGMYVYINDRKLLVAALLKRNWECVGHSDAGSRRLAIKEFPAEA